MSYVSLTLTAPCVMWLPLIQMWARPSQPLLPYAALQTSTRPLVGRQRLMLLEAPPPATIVVSSTEDWVQSEDVVARIGCHVLDTLSPSFSVNEGV